MVAGFMAPYVFGKARESFVITTGIDTKLGSAPKSTVGISGTSDRDVFFLKVKYARRIRRYFWVPLKSSVRKKRPVRLDVTNMTFSIPFLEPFLGALNSVHGPKHLQQAHA